MCDLLVNGCCLWKKEQTILHLQVCGTCCCCSIIRMASSNNQWVFICLSLIYCLALKSFGEFALPSSRFPQLLLLISSNVDFKGWFARDPSVLHRVGHVLLKVKAVEPKRARRLVFADDLFQLSKVPKQKTVYVVSKAIEKLSGCKLYGLQFLFISVACFSGLKIMILTQCYLFCYDAVTFTS